MYKTFNDIFNEIRQFLDITVKTGYTDSEFMSDTMTILSICKCKGLKYCAYRKCNDSLTVTLIEPIVQELVIDSAKPIWRINQKRVAHGLPTWFAN